jgi:hypothetical protein
VIRQGYTHSPRESESCYLGVEFRPSQPGSFEQALRLSYDNGLAVQTATLRLEGAGYLPSASENVLVIYNEAIPESVDIKNEYLARRPGFAQVNVLGVSIPANGGGVPLEVMTKQDYQQRLLEPLAAVAAGTSPKAHWLHRVAVWHPHHAQMAGTWGLGL